MDRRMAWCCRGSARCGFASVLGGVVASFRESLGGWLRRGESIEGLYKTSGFGLYNRNIRPMQANSWPLLFPNLEAQRPTSKCIKITQQSNMAATLRVVLFGNDGVYVHSVSAN